MYSKAEQFDKAAGILILTKNFAAVTPLLDKITLPKLHSQYAKVCAGVVSGFLSQGIDCSFCCDSPG